MREIHNLYQSGQMVAVSRTYEIVGAPRPELQCKNNPVIQELHQGEFFPDYDGRAVCWVLVQVIEPQRPEPSTTPA